jgi:O-antigen ligase
LLAALTGSTAAVAIVLTLLFFSVLLAYVLGFPGVRRFHRSTVVVTGLAMAAAAAAILISVDLQPVVNRFKLKADNYEQTGFDDRMPLRRATWALIEDGGWEGRAWVGYGAGSYRWISPPYQAQQKELQHSGRLYYRADYAHNDWLEMLATWGIIGLLPVLVFLGWLFRWLARAFRRGHPESYPLALVLILLGLHAGFDLLFWFTPLMFTAAFVLAAMTTFTERSSAEKARALS